MDGSETRPYTTLGLDGSETRPYTTLGMGGSETRPYTNLGMGGSETRPYTTIRDPSLRGQARWRGERPYVDRSGAASGNRAEPFAIVKVVFMVTSRVSVSS